MPDKRNGSGDDVLHYDVDLSDAISTDRTCCEMQMQRRFRISGRIFGHNSIFLNKKV